MAAIEVEVSMRVEQFDIWGNSTGLMDVDYVDRSVRKKIFAHLRTALNDAISKQEIIMKLFDMTAFQGNVQIYPLCPVGARIPNMPPQLVADTNSYLKQNKLNTGYSTIDIQLSLVGVFV